MKYYYFIIISVEYLLFQGYYFQTKKMLKVAILDDYQNIAKDFIDLKKLSSKYEFQIFNQPFENEDDAIEQLKEFDVLFIMRERTKITKNLIAVSYTHLRAHETR